MGSQQCGPERHDFIPGGGREAEHGAQGGAGGGPVSCVLFFERWFPIHRGHICFIDLITIGDRVPCNRSTNPDLQRKKYHLTRLPGYPAMPRVNVIHCLPLFGLSSDVHTKYFSPNRGVSASHLGPIYERINEMTKLGYQ